MKPARFVLSLVGVALFLTVGTIFAIEAIARLSDRPSLGWETGAAVWLGPVLLTGLILRATLLWIEKRKERR